MPLSQTTRTEIYKTLDANPLALAAVLNIPSVADICRVRTRPATFDIGAYINQKYPVIAAKALGAAQDAGTNAYIDAYNKGYSDPNVIANRAGIMAYNTVIYTDPVDGPAIQKGINEILKSSKYSGTIENIQSDIDETPGLSDEIATTMVDYLPKNTLNSIVSDAGLDTTMSPQMVSVESFGNMSKKYVGVPLYMILLVLVLIGIAVAVMCSKRKGQVNLSLPQQFARFGRKIKNLI
jgi:hypothetical protein